MKYFLLVLTLIFITLKLTGNIDWSWWWVLSPILIYIATLGVLLMIAGGLATYLHKLQNK